jgi:hypothetical protein
MPTEGAAQRIHPNLHPQRTLENFHRFPNGAEAPNVQRCVNRMLNDLSFCKNAWVVNAN